MTASNGAPSAQMPNVGDTVAGKFVIERLIGQGGMGAVFAARHRELDSVVAVKIMLADTTNVEATARFKNEGRAAARIRSQHVVRVEDVGEENGYAYMILELLDGEDLAQILEKRRRIPPAEVAHYMAQALEGVRLAHDKGIVHRDLKPSNLFLAKRDDGTSVVKVLDFGISKSANALSQAASNLTSTKAMLGSPLYMSPEQLRSSKSVDVRADIWALGVIMYELLTGTLPFMGESLGELFAAILETDPTPPSVRAPEVSPELDAIVMRCLQRRPENRFSSVVELASALSAFSSGATTLGPMGTQMLPAGAAGAAFTAALAGHHHGPQPSQPHIAGGYGPPPGPRPSFPGATTTGGSGSNIPVVKGAAPFGGTTPQPYLHAQSSNQLAPGAITAPGVPSKKNTAFVLAIAGAAVFVVGGAVLGGLALRKNHDDGKTTGAVTASASASGTTEASVAVSAPPPPSATELTPAAPSESAALAAAAPEATASAKKVVAHGSGAAVPKPKEPAQPKAEPSKPADPKPVDPKPKPSEPKFENVR